MDESARLLSCHFAAGRFLAGQAIGRWTLIEVGWPHAVVEVAARDGCRYALRFDCAGYPEQAPTAMLWNVGAKQMLAPADWPQGGRVSQVFNPNWKNGTALYLPCDRESIAGHPNWTTEYPSQLWDPARGITLYLEIVHELLQSNELISKAA
jgi:hypothetical protein